MKFKDGGFYTTERISPRLEKTPEGFLVCKGVPVSRVGDFDYTELESGINGINGVAKITRSADELFRDETMRSFEGKPVVIGHSSFVDPKNWKRRSIGVIQNVRRGEGDESSMLLADLLLTDDEGIRLVENGDLREVSCGYDAALVEDAPGRGHQTGIVGNHVALVPKGRCGDACKIRDGQMTTNLKTLLRRFFKDGDDERFNEVLDQAVVKPIDEDGTNPLNPKVDKEKTPEERIAVLEHEYGEMGQKIDAMRQMLEKLMPKEPTGDEDPAPEDDPKDEEKAPEEELVTDECAKEVLDEAEELCPGMKRPVGDAKDGKFTVNQMDRVMREALKGSDVKQFGDAATLDGAALKTAFKAALLLKRAENNPVPKKKIGDEKPQGRMTNAELNSYLAKQWGK